MNLLPGEDIGFEVHEIVDQFIRIEGVVTSEPKKATAKQTPIERINFHQLFIGISIARIIRAIYW